MMMESKEFKETIDQLLRSKIEDQLSNMLTEIYSGGKEISEASADTLNSYLSKANFQLRTTKPGWSKPRDTAKLRQKRLQGTKLARAKLDNEPQANTQVESIGDVLKHHVKHAIAGGIGIHPLTFDLLAKRKKQQQNHAAIIKNALKKAKAQPPKSQQHTGTSAAQAPKPSSPHQPQGHDIQTPMSRQDLAKQLKMHGNDLKKIKLDKA
jgi:hypothetical protein